METKEIVKSTIQKSPEWLQDLIFSDALEETITSICEPYNYPKEKIDDVTNTVALLLFGLATEEKLLESLARVAASKDEIEQIKKDIVEYVLDPIKKDLLEEMPVEVPIEKVVTLPQIPPNPVGNTPEIAGYVEVVNYKPGMSLKDTLLKKENAAVSLPLQKEKSSFERRLAGFNDNEESAMPPKTSLADPYREGV